MITTREEYKEEIARMVSRRSALEDAAEKLRVSRLKIGALLDRLEAVELKPDELDHLREQIDAVAFEVDNLVVLMHCVSDGKQFHWRQ